MNLKAIINTMLIIRHLLVQQLIIPLYYQTTDYELQY